MKLSTNMILQILSLFAQGINQISDFLPQSKKIVAALIIGVIQSISALVAHFSNPDGTDAAMAYKSSDKTSRLPVCILLPFLLFAALPARAQTDTVYAGMVANSESTDNVKVSFQYERLIFGQVDELWSVYNTVSYDITGIKLRPQIDLSNIQHSATEGMETIVLKPFKSVSVLLKGDVGINGVQSVATGLLASGGGGVKFTKGVLALKFYGQVLKTTVQGINAELRGYVGFRFK